MLHAKYQPNRPNGSGEDRPNGSGEEGVWIFFIIYGHAGHLESRIMTCLAKSCTTII